MENNNGKGFAILAPELWVKVVETLDNIHDVENFCLVHETVRPFLDSHFKKLKAEREKQALLLVVQQGLVSATNGLKMRLVSKNWCRTMDEFYSRLHGRKSCLLPSYFPKVTIPLPLTETGAKRIEELAENKDYKFVGGQVRLLFVNPSQPPLGPPIEDESFQSIWKRATNLTVETHPNRSYYAGNKELCAPFLRHMTNVKSISVGWGIAQRLILCLPNPEKLEFIKTDNELMIDDAWVVAGVGWMQVFQSCNSNLKIFECVNLATGMQLAANQVTFDSLEELVVHGYLSKFEWEAMPRLLTEGGFTIGLPKLKIIAVPMYDDRMNWEEDWIFPGLLMEITNNIQTLEVIQIVVNYRGFTGTGDFWIQHFPIDLRIIGRGSPNVRQLEFHVYSFQGVLDSDFKQWCFTLASVWPSFRVLQISSGRGIRDPLRKWRYEKIGGDAWELVQAQLMCKECC